MLFLTSAHVRRNSPALNWLRTRLKTPVTALLLASFSLWATQSQAATGLWVPTAAGTYYWQGTNYGDANTPVIAPWGTTGTGTDASPFLLNPIPLLSGDIANLNNNIAGNQTIVLDGPIVLTTLNIGDSDSTHGFTINSGLGGALELAGATPSIVKTGTITDIINSNILLSAGTLMSVATGGQLSLNGIVSGANALTKLGAGNLLLSGANLYSLGTTVGDGTNPGGALILGSSSVGGQSGAAITSGPLGTGAVTLAAASAATIQSDSATTRTLSNAITANSDFTLGATGTGNVVLGGAISLGAGLRVITSVGNNFLSGVVSSGSFSKAGTGSLTLMNANTSLTAANLSAGQLVAGNAASFGTTSAITISGGTLAAKSAITLPATNTFTVTGDFAIGADPRVAGNYDGNLTLAGTVNLGAAVRTITVANSGVPSLVNANADTL